MPCTTIDCCSTSGIDLTLSSSSEFDNIPALANVNVGAKFGEILGIYDDFLREKFNDHDVTEDRIVEYLTQFAPSIISSIYAGEGKLARDSVELQISAISAKYAAMKIEFDAKVIKATLPYQVNTAKSQCILTAQKVKTEEELTRNLRYKNGDGLYSASLPYWQTKVNQAQHSLYGIQGHSFQNKEKIDAYRAVSANWTVFNAEEFTGTYISWQEGEMDEMTSEVRIFAGIN